MWLGRRVGEQLHFLVYLSTLRLCLRLRLVLIVIRLTLGNLLAGAKQ